MECKEPAEPFFGPAGSGEDFSEAGLKSVLEIPAFLAGMGLNAYEYQATHGVRISAERAGLLGEAAKKFSIRLSLHSPYYISLSSTEEEKRLASVNYILQSARAARNMGASRIIVHSGSCGKMPREQALEYAGDTLRRAMAALDAEGLSEISICPETMGKLNQLGTVDEVMELCSLDERLVPCIDFGHINARTGGGLKTAGDFLQIIDKIEERLGEERARSFHAHFSKIEYTKQGEKRHLTFEDTTYGPDFEPLAEACCKRGCRPVIICESGGTQERDALTMKNIYQASRAVVPAEDERKDK